MSIRNKPAKLDLIDRLLEIEGKCQVELKPDGTYVVTPVEKDPPVRRGISAMEERQRYYHSR